jgi:hypothetical protein
VLDAALYAHAAPGLRDVRLLQDGREIPYATDVSLDDRTGDSSVILPDDRAQYETVAVLPLLPGRDHEAFAEGGPAELSAHTLLPAHVPVERIRVDPAPTASAELTLRAAPKYDLSDAESTVANLTPERPSTSFTIGANLQEDADIGVGLTAPAGMKAMPRVVVLEMRRREICYQPISPAPIRLLFGDAAADPVHYDYAAHFQPRSAPLLATMGPRQPNPGFRPMVMHAFVLSRLQRIELGIAGCLVALVLTLAPLLRLRR